jgi:2'-5' RNA ligase
VTLRFLGRASTGAACAALGTVRAQVSEARLGPRPVWLGRGVLCLPVRGLEALAAAVIGATALVGRPPERRPFRGHLTLARRRGRRRSAPDRVEFSVPDAPDVRFAVDEVVLMRSVLHATGAVHEPVMRHRLRPPDAGAGG